MAADGMKELKAEAAAAAAVGEGQEASLVRAPVKHVLSKELQLYFDRVARILRAKPGQPSQIAPYHCMHACRSADVDMYLYADTHVASVSALCVMQQQS